MPEVLFTIQLPNGAEKQCYSPSTIVRDYFASGEEMAVSEFRVRSRKAFAEASERVRAKYGFACSSAASQLADLEEMIRKFPDTDTVRILEI
jgi:uncharacterized repeat protein (TIGR04042 family)